MQAANEQTALHKPEETNQTLTAYRFTVQKTIEKYRKGQGR
jgi:hypothetical protein